LAGVFRTPLVDIKALLKQPFLSLARLRVEVPLNELGADRSQDRKHGQKDGQPDWYGHA
jgi:hypothetical protein